MTGPDRKSPSLTLMLAASAAILLACPAARADDDLRQGLTTLFGDDNRAVRMLDWVDKKREQLDDAVGDMKSTAEKAVQPSDNDRHKTVIIPLTEAQQKCAANRIYCGPSTYDEVRNGMERDVVEKGWTTQLGEKLDEARERVQQTVDSVVGPSEPSEVQRSIVLGARSTQLEGTASLPGGAAEQQSLARDYQSGSSADGSPPMTADQILVEQQALSNNYQSNAGSEVTIAPEDLSGLPPPEPHLTIPDSDLPQDWSNAAPQPADDGRTRWESLDEPASPPPSAPAEASNSSPIEGGYEPTTVESAGAATSTYGSLPGGVACETTGASDSFAAGTRRLLIRIDRGEALLWPSNRVYRLPLPASRIPEMVDAVFKDERLGVSLAGAGIVYGAMPANSPTIDTLFIADAFLGDLVFYGGDSMLPDIYEPLAKIDLRRFSRRFGGVVFFSFRQKGFSVETDAIRSNGLAIVAQLIPGSTAPAADGGVLPDIGRIKSGYDPSPGLTANTRAVMQAVTAIGDLAPVRAAADVCETHAFLKLVKDSGLAKSDIAYLKGR